MEEVRTARERLEEDKRSEEERLLEEFEATKQNLEEHPRHCWMWKRSLQ